MSSYKDFWPIVAIEGGAPYHPMTEGKIERWHQTLKNRILLENYFLPSDLEAQIAVFINDYNHRRYHESLDNLTPADVHFGRDPAILAERQRIKRQAIANRRLQHRLQAGFGRLRWLGTLSSNGAESRPIASGAPMSQYFGSRGGSAASCPIPIMSASIGRSSLVSSVSRDRGNETYLRGPLYLGPWRQRRST